MKTIGRVKIEGLRETVAALRELPKATARNVLKRVLTRRAEPIAETMRSLAPDDPATHGEDLRGSIAVSSKLSKRQAALHRKETRDDKQFAEVFVGAGPLPQAHLTEFGGPNNSPHSWARTAWDRHQDSTLEGIGEDLWKEIEVAAKRRAARLARIAAKG